MEVKQRQSDDTDGVLVPTGPLQQLTQCQCVTNTAEPLKPQVVTICEAATVCELSCR